MQNQPFYVRWVNTIIIITKKALATTSAFFVMIIYSYYKPLNSNPFLLQYFIALGKTYSSLGNALILS
jgi:hypothetical protein